MKKLFLSVAILASVFGSMTGLAFAATPTDAARLQVCKGINSQVSGSDCGGATGANTLNNIIKAVLQILTWIAGIAAVIMVVLAGLKYITSGGDSSGVASAKNSLIYALVGLVIVAIAQSLVIFVLNKATTHP
jgi:Trk-type K+ transport system membrane component